MNFNFIQNLVTQVRNSSLSDKLTFVGAAGTLCTFLYTGITFIPEQDNRIVILEKDSKEYRKDITDIKNDIKFLTRVIQDYEELKNKHNVLEGKFAVALDAFMLNNRTSKKANN